MGKKLTCIDSFSGAGGLSIGLKDAGFKMLYAFDNNAAAVESYNHFFSGNHCEVMDAREITGEFILKKIKLSAGEELDLFAGGPPCQGFSRQRRGAESGSDKRNELVIEYARIVSELHPKAFMLENVDIEGSREKSSGKVWQSHAVERQSAARKRLRAYP